MGDAQEYAVSGDIDRRTEQSFVDVLKYNDTIASIFGSPDDVNIRRSKDKTQGKRTLPALSINCLPEQSIPRTNEYHGRCQIFCETQADDDPDGQQVQALEGAVRDAMHADSTPEYPGHFKGDCEGFLEALNNTSNGIVFHQVHEMALDDSDEGRNRILIINVDVWMYPGASS